MSNQTQELMPLEVLKEDAKVFRELSDDTAGTTSEAYFRELAERAELAASRWNEGSAQGWRPIETAPRNGTAIMLYRPSGNHLSYGIGSYLSGARNTLFKDFHGMSWAWCISNPPTHWQPLPEPPATEDGKGGRA